MLNMPLKSYLGGINSQNFIDAAGTENIAKILNDRNKP